MNPWYVNDKLALLAIVLVAFVVVLVSSAAHVNAAPPDVPECDAINTTGAIIVYRCLPNEGTSYLLNSFGFMILEE